MIGEIAVPMKATWCVCMCVCVRACVCVHARVCVCVCVCMYRGGEGSVEDGILGVVRGEVEPLVDVVSASLLLLLHDLVLGLLPRVHLGGCVGAGVCACARECVFACVCACGCACVYICTCVRARA